MKVSKSLLKFLKDLSKHNNREWFVAHKAEFKQHEAAVKMFFQAVCEGLETHDHIERHRTYRIYRDVRFSKDKSPFKTYLGGNFVRATAALRGGYVMSIEPGGKTRVGGGFFSPNAKDLMRIRKEFAFDDTEIRSILNDEKFKATFGELQGLGVKTAPRGFSTEHPAIDLIRKKQFYAMRNFTDKEVTQADFMEQVNDTFLALRPYFDYMSLVLTTDLNGESLLNG